MTGQTRLVHRAQEGSELYFVHHAIPNLYVTINSNIPPKPEHGQTPELSPTHAILVSGTCGSN